MNAARSDDAEPVLVRREASLDPDLASASAARRLLVDALREAGREEWIEAGALALSEVVTNAALHAHTAIGVLIEVLADCLRVEVSDSNPMLPRPRQYDDEATTGRGMALVAALTDACGTRSLGGQGKIVWFTLSGDVSADPSEPLLAAWDVDLESPDTEDLPATRTVVLTSMPTMLWLAARQHHDAILRELVLYLAEHDGPTVDLAAADTARTLIAGAVVDAVESGAGSELDLAIDVPTGIAPAYDALRLALDTAERLATDGKLLTRPGLPEIVAVREWACTEIQSQLAGGPATAWQGADQSRFETAVNAMADDDEMGWDDRAVRESDVGVVAADEANRIVAVSRRLADLLGWAVDDLVGRRVVTLIPPRLREAHVAGFTRHLTTGEARVLGQSLVLPVLRADGTELDCSFRVDRAPDTGGRRIYLAWIDRAEAE